MAELIKIEGEDRLARKFRTLESDYQGVYRGMKKATEIVRGAAVLRCPVNHGELRGSLHGRVVVMGDKIRGIVGTNKDYGPYVEFGTGPVGAARHSGVSPNVPVTYRLDSWWFPADAVDPRDADRYKWPSYTTKEGKTFYLTKGQPAQPFLYPAMKAKETEAVRAIKREVSTEFRKISRG